MKRIPWILLMIGLVVCPVCVMAQDEASSDIPEDDVQVADTDGPFSAEDLVAYTASVAEASKLASCEETRKAIRGISSDLRRRAAQILLIPEVYDLNPSVLNEIRGYVRVAAARKAKCPVIVEAYRELAAEAASQEKNK